MTIASNASALFAKSSIASAIKGDADTHEISWQRRLIANIAGLTTAGIGGYAGGYFAGTLAVAAILLTGSAFLGYAVLILGIVVAVVAAMEAGMRTTRYIALREIDKDWNNAKSTVRGWFKRTPAVQATEPIAQATQVAPATEPQGTELNNDYVAVKAAAKKARSKVANSNADVLSRMRRGMV